LGTYRGFIEGVFGMNFDDIKKGMRLKLIDSFGYHDCKVGDIFIVTYDKNPKIKEARNLRVGRLFGIPKECGYQFDSMSKTFEELLE
jgi:hypothetical protein